MLAFASCVPAADQANPLLEETYSTPFQTPPFDLIRVEHYKPAMEFAMEQHKAEIEAIVNNPEPPTFENTLAAYDRSGRLLQRVDAIFSTVSGADTDEQLQALEQELTPMLTQHYNEIGLNPKLFERIKAVYEQRGQLDLTPQALRTLEKIYENFVRNGSNLSAENKETLKEINRNLSHLCMQYGQNILKETNGFRMVVDDAADLKGLPQANMDVAAARARAEGMDGKYLFTPHKPFLIPLLQYAENRGLREKLYKAYYMRGDNDNEYDNKALIGRILNERLKKAQLLGYENYAAYVLERNMAKNAKNVIDFLERIWKPALKAAKQELAQMQAMADKAGAGYKIRSWDWWYWAEKLRKEKYGIDEQELMPYLSYDRVRDGMFYVAGQLYGLTFKRLTDVPVYNPSVETFEVLDRDGSHLAVLYIDYITRPGKRAGAWCSHLRSYRKFPDGSEQFPLISICCNFSAPAADKPALLTWDETETLFHEFGHALHGFFSRGDYGPVCGNLPRDMVELPSQIDENWASRPEVLKHYAKHYQTGEPMPDTLIQKLVNSAYFNQGFLTTELVAASLLDMCYHAATTEREYDVRAFEKQAMDRYGLIPEILPRYRSTYFSHIFDGGYAVGYYVYLWAEVLDADAFDAFVRSGDIFNREYADKFRKYILTEGGWDEPMDQYFRFRGEQPSEKPLLRSRGLL